MRADVNLSVREAGSQTLGTRTEMKNLNSFKAIARAIEGERDRQIELLEQGRSVVQETRRWDDNKEDSRTMRSKEDAKDYRYFPDPDLPPVEIGTEWLERMRAALPELREEKLERLRRETDIPEYDLELLTASRHMADIFEETVTLGAPAKEASNWLLGETMRMLKERELDPEEIRFSPAHLAKLIRLVEDRTVNRTAAKEIFEEMFDRDVEPESHAREKGLLTVHDEAGLRTIIEKLFGENLKSVEDYRAGKERALGFLIGQTMKASRGKADPVRVKEIWLELL